MTPTTLLLAAGIDYTNTTWLATAALAVLTVLAAGVAWYYSHQYLSERHSVFEDFLARVEDDVDDGVLVSFEPPSVNAGFLGILGVWWGVYRQQRLAKKGYVKWHRLDSTLDHHSWVKPSQDGAGLPKVTISGQPYYFPKDAMVADSVTGAWTALHREGEADPINLREPAYPGIETDLVERTINLEAENKPPGFLDNLFGMDQSTMMYVLIGVMFVIYAGYRYLGGGM